MRSIKSEFLFVLDVHTFLDKGICVRTCYLRARSLIPAAMWETGWGEACERLLKLMKNLLLAENLVNLGVIMLSKVPSHYSIQLF